MSAEVAGSSTNDFRLLALSRMRRLSRVVEMPMTMDDYGPFVSELTLLSEYVVKDRLVESGVPENAVRSHDLVELVRRLSGTLGVERGARLLDDAIPAAAVLGAQSVRSRYDPWLYDENGVLILLGACDSFIESIDKDAGIPTEVADAWHASVREGLRSEAGRYLKDATAPSGAIRLPKVPEEVLSNPQSAFAAKRLGSDDVDWDRSYPPNVGRFLLGDTEADKT